MGNETQSNFHMANRNIGTCGRSHILGVRSRAQSASHGSAGEEKWVALSNDDDVLSAKKCKTSHPPSNNINQYVISKSGMQYKHKNHYATKQAVDLWFI